MNTFPLTADHPIEVVNLNSSPHLRWAGEFGFWARITGKCTEDPGAPVGLTLGLTQAGDTGSGSGICTECRYTWEEVRTNAETCTPDTADRTGSYSRIPAVEITGNAAVPTGAIVWLNPGDTRGDWLSFKYSETTNTTPIFGYVSGAATTQSGVDFYPGNVWELSDPADGASAYVATSTIWIRSVTAQPLTTGGVYNCILQLEEYDVGGDSRPLYGTRDRQVVIDCSDGNLVYYG